MTRELAEAVATLYSAFGAYRPPREGDFCEHCLRAEDVAALRNAPLRELAEPDLFPYLIKAMGTWGGVEEYKYFLPRMLELLAMGRWADLPMLAGRIGDDWPEPEQAALRRFFDAWLLECPQAMPLEEAVRAVLILGRDLGFHLREWERRATPGTVRRIAELITCMPALGAPHDETLRRWLGGEGVGDLLLRAAVEEGEGFGAALEAHDFWRSWGTMK
ncbi:hypothetical protein [Actinomadura macrotermitis]|uniref:Uncharacterized protein n=1 Tax=Actinomadura macrotermitis TaxID=2585200 RepID=A0A7K0BX54_9ACTN|nr:hypothetical protein [Actinomadura macrotermitis]MQY05757.1 hypothetical protein [Actinomadura macrotermitis]